MKEAEGTPMVESARISLMGSSSCPLMDTVWDLGENKVQLQQFYIKWITEIYKGERSAYLGGNSDQLSSCLLISENTTTWEPLLQCQHEEADDRLMSYFRITRH